MRTLNAALIPEKNALRSEIPWAHLFHIRVDDNPDNDRRLAAHQVDVDWNGYTWEATEFDIDPITEHGSGRLADLNVTLQNVDRQVSAYLEQGTIIGRDVTIYIVPVDTDITTGIISWTYRVNRAHTTVKVGTFELGHENLFALEVPWQRYIRDKCRFGFKDAKCNYPNDEFHRGSTQYLKDGGDGVKFGGWNTLNMANAAYATININSADNLYMYLANSGPYTWNNTTRTSPFVYKELTGDFDVNTFVSASPPTDYGGMLWIIQSPDDLDDWVAIGQHRVSSVNYNFYRSTQSGVSTDTTQQPLRTYLRWVRAGDEFTAYGRTSPSLDWTQQWTVTRADMPRTLRIGFSLYSTSSTPIYVMFDYFRADSGGLASCDYTLEGDNGCRAHQNQRCFGGAPGLPYGRLYF